MHTGDILRSIRLTIKATCPLNLEYFPMDKQMCTLEIESFGYTMSGTVKDTRDHSRREVAMYFLTDIQLNQHIEVRQVAHSHPPLH